MARRHANVVGYIPPLQRFAFGRLTWLVRLASIVSRMVAMNSGHTMSDESAELDWAASPESVSILFDAIDHRDIKTLSQLIVDIHFMLINVGEADEEDEEALGAVTGQVDDREVLIAFTSEEFATEFVDEMGEMFDEGKKINGFVVDGVSLLNYLPEEFGILLNPETEGAALIDSELAEDLITATSPS